MIDKSKLSSYAKEVFELMISRHPGWLEIAKNVKYQADPLYSWDEPSEEGFEINIQCPTAGNPPLNIMFLNPEEDDFIIFFGPAYIGMHGMKLTRHSTALEIANKIDTVVEEIYSEKLISAEWKSFILCGGFIGIDRYKNKLRKGKIIKSVSWKGTYNYKIF
jgi:hypothetical protein